MLDRIQPSVRDRTQSLRSEFSGAQPFRHVVIDDFLDPDLCARLIQEFPAFDARNAVNEHGEVGRKAVFTDVARIGRSYAEFDRLMRSPAFLDWLGTLVEIPRLVYDRDYVGGGTHENLDGQELDPHVDFNFHPLRPLHRRLNLIVFLNPEWQETWGGCLELESDPWRPETKGPRQRILPLANRCVVFETTESSWHGFSRIQLPAGRRNESRRSIAVYFYTRQRAGVETAPSHSTIYVPRPMGAHFQPGYALQPEDVQELEVLIGRRDRQIRYLYERELDFSTTLAGIYRSPSFRLGRTLTWPLRWLRERWKPKPATAGTPGPRR
jgi:hypothetical protein